MARAPDRPNYTEPLRVLDTEGKLLRPAPLTPDQSLEALRLMKLSRSLDTYATRLQRAGRIGLYTPVLGQEASVVGSSLALDPSRDWLVPSYREQPAMLRHGFPLDRLLAQYLGRIGSTRIPDNVKMLPRNQVVAAQLPHAVGLALGLRIQGIRTAVLVYFGDGAASEGDFHEAANLAGVTKAPLVMFLQNNGYAISTPGDKQTAAVSLAIRALGYGITGDVVDGNDLFAVYEATQMAVRRALSGEGTSLIESRTYRLSFHNTSDNPKAYRSDEEVHEAQARDPIVRVERYLASIGRWNDDMADTMQATITNEIEQAFARATAFPKPDPREIFANVYAHPPGRVLSQREEFDVFNPDHSRGFVS